MTWKKYKISITDFLIYDVKHLNCIVAGMFNTNKLDWCFYQLINIHTSESSLVFPILRKWVSYKQEVVEYEIKLIFILC